MRSLRFLVSRRWIAFFLVVVVLAYATWWLGEWQFGRLEDRKRDNAVVERNEAVAPAAVDDVLAVGRAVDPEDEWRLVTASGTYLTDETVIVRYRTREGASGVDVVVPLQTDSGAALLVDRGWLASDNGAAPDEVPTPPAGPVSVTGYVRVDATGDSAKVSDHSTRSISSAQIGPAIGRETYGGFVELASEDPSSETPLEPAELPLAQPPGGVRERDHDQEERDPPSAHQEAEGSHPTRLVGRAGADGPDRSQPGRT